MRLSRRLDAPCIHRKSINDAVGVIVKSQNSLAANVTAFAGCVVAQSNAREDVRAKFVKLAARKIHVKARRAGELLNTNTKKQNGEMKF